MEMKRILKTLGICTAIIVVLSFFTALNFELTTLAATGASQNTLNGLGTSGVADPQLQSLLQGITQNKQQTAQQTTTQTSQAQTESAQKTIDSINQRLSALGNWAIVTMLLIVLTTFLFWIFLIIAIVAIARWLSTKRTLVPQPHANRVM